MPTIIQSLITRIKLLSQYYSKEEEPVGVKIDHFNWYLVFTTFSANYVMRFNYLVLVKHVFISIHNLFSILIYCYNCLTSYIIMALCIYFIF